MSTYEMTPDEARIVAMLEEDIARCTRQLKDGLYEDVFNGDREIGLHWHREMAVTRAMEQYVYTIRNGRHRMGRP